MAILTLFRHRFYKNDGTVNALGKVYTYEAGTTTPTETYTSSSGAVANTNPIILDAKGEADIWVVGQIKVNVLESNDTQVTGWPVDNIGSGVSNNDAQMRWSGTATGTENALSISPSPSVTAYTTGQSFVFKSSASANTAATTISVSGLAAIAVQVDGAACSGGEIQASKWYMIVLSSTTAAQLSPIGATGIIVADAAADTTCWPLLATSQTGNQQPRTDAGLTYNASTNVLTTGEFKANGTAGGLEITTANAADTYQVNIAGTMTLDTATLNSIQHTTTVTGGATTTAIRGFLHNPTFTPTANLTSAYGIYNFTTLNSGASVTTWHGQHTRIALGASALGGTISVNGHYIDASFNASATTDVTEWNSYVAANIADGAGTTVSAAYGFRGLMASGTGRWNCYMSGTANNAFAGNCRFGGVTAPTVAVDVTGAVLATTSIKSSGASSGIGYATGAGGSVTQLTSISTAVTLNTICGRIVGFNGTYNANTQTTFTVNNNVIEAYDVVVINENGNNAGLVITANTGSGAFAVNIRNITAGNISVQLSLNFAIIKVVNA